MASPNEQNAALASAPSVAVALAMNASKTAFQVINQWNEEVVRFVADRLGKDAAFQSALTRGGDPAAMLQDYVAFMRQAGSDYVDEWARLQKMSAEALASDVTHPAGTEEADPYEGQTGE